MSDVSLPPFLELRTLSYPEPDLQAATAEATAVLGVEPYFDSDFYVGYSISGYEFALDPRGPRRRSNHLLRRRGRSSGSSAVKAGALLVAEIEDVGDGIRTAIVNTPSLHGRIGIIENPHFLPADVSADSCPGR